MRAIASLAIGAGLLVGCSGGGGASAPLPLTRAPHISPSASPVGTISPKRATGKILVRLTVPQFTAHKAASLKRPSFVSPATRTVKFEGFSKIAGDPNDGSIETDTTVSISLTAPGCSESAGSLTCTITLTAPLGRNTFNVFAYDANGIQVAGNTAVTTPSGTDLVDAITVVLGSANRLTVTLSGIPASYTLTQAALLHGGSAATVDLAYMAFDADGYAIGQPHPNTFVSSNGGFPGVAIGPGGQSQAGIAPYTFTFSGLHLDSSTFTQLCTTCLQLENPGDLTLTYDGTDPFDAVDEEQQFKSDLATAFFGDGFFTPVVDFGFSLSPNALHFVSDSSAAQSVSVSGVNVAGVEVLTSASSGQPCGDASASLNGSTITITPAVGMPTECVLAINRRFQGSVGQSVPVYSAIPISVGTDIGTSDGTESTGHIAFTSALSAPQTITITPATGYSGSVSPSAYKCWSPNFSLPLNNTATNEVPLASVASITPSSGVSVNGSPVVFTIKPIAPGVCAMQTPGLAGNDPLGFVLAVGF